MFRREVCSLGTASHMGESTHIVVKGDKKVELQIPLIIKHMIVLLTSV